METHWAYGYIGKPWVLGTSGPDSYDCWGLVRAVLAEHFAINVPPIIVPEVPAAEGETQSRHASGLAVVRAAMEHFQHHPELARWQQVDRPRHGDGVQMSAARNPWHVGLWLEADGGGVLHCLEGAGVIFTQPVALNVAGWRRLSYWRFVGEAA